MMVFVDPDMVFDVCRRPPTTAPLFSRQRQPRR